jgi:NhaP-type Na+/H+ or K+/H+ antiporter
LSTKDKLFIGWFGPRGLASIVLVIIALEESESIPGMAVVVTVVLVTVVISIFAHVITAAPLARRLYSNQDS